MKRSLGMWRALQRVCGRIHTCQCGMPVRWAFGVDGFELFEYPGRRTHRSCAHHGAPREIIMRKKGR